MKLLIAVAGVTLALAACSSDGRQAVRSSDASSSSVEVVSGAEEATTTTSVAPSGGGTTTTTTAAAARVTSTTAGKAATASSVATTAPVATTSTTGAPAATTTTVAGSPASTTTSTTIRDLETVPALLIPNQPCSTQLEAAFPVAIDQAKLKADLEAQGYAMPTPTMFRDRDGAALPNPPERNTDQAQRKINDCAAAKGEPVSGQLKLGSGSQGSTLLGQLVKDQVTAVGFKNYTGTTVVAS